MTELEVLQQIADGQGAIIIQLICIAIELACLMIIVYNKE